MLVSVVGSLGVWGGEDGGLVDGECVGGVRGLGGGMGEMEGRWGRSSQLSSGRSV